MPELTYKCDGHDGRCGREFKPGEWECFPGKKHQVESKTYYMADAPHCDFKLDPNGIAFRSARTYLHVVPEEVNTDEMGKLFKTGFPPAVFVMGRYETADPQFQFFLEHGTARTSLCSEAKWFDVYHTPIQKQNIKDNELRTRAAQLETKTAEFERKERELNDALADLKRSKEAKRA